MKLLPLALADALPAGSAWGLKMTAVMLKLRCVFAGSATFTFTVSTSGDASLPARTIGTFTLMYVELPMGMTSKGKLVSGVIETKFGTPIQSGAFVMSVSPPLPYST